MAKRVFIIHGWGGCPEEGWFPWLKGELEKRGFIVQVPEMPDTENPKIDTWVPFLSRLVHNPDGETLLVGHSIGCQTILRYLESLGEGVRIGGAVLVAGWVSLTNLSGPKEERIARLWLERPIEWDRVLRHTRNFVAVFSDNDNHVPVSNSEVFRKRLGARIFLEHGKGHFTGDEGVKEIPVVLNSLLEMA